MIAVALLIADAGEIIKILIFLLIIGGSLIGKLINAPGRQQVRRKPQPQPQRARGGAKPAAAGAGGRGGMQANLEREIEQFLQRARGAQQPPAAGQMKPAPPVVAEAMSAEVVTPGDRFGSGVKSHVRDHLGPKISHEREAQLGETLDHTDERVEERLHEKFDHDLGRLEKKATGAEREVSQGTDAAVWGDQESGRLTAEEIQSKLAGMLRSPGDIRDAILLSEILERPSSRWD